MAEKKTIVFEGYSRRLDIFVSDELENFSRSLVQKLIKDGKVTVNGKKVKPSWPLAEGEVVEIELPQAGSKTQLKDLIIHMTLILLPFLHKKVFQSALNNAQHMQS